MAKIKYLSILSYPVSSFILRALLAVAGGFISGYAYPRENVWWVIFISVASLFAAIKSMGFWSATLLGFLGGLAFYLAQIEWLSLYLGWLPWVALSIMQAIFFAFAMGVSAVIWRWLDSRLIAANRAIVIPLALACIWTAREWFSSHWPYGGFPWSRLAQSQSDSFLATWVYYGGMPMLSFVVAFISLLMLMGIQERKRGGNTRRAVAFLIAVLIPMIPVTSAAAESGYAVVGAVQGNANAGLFANPVPGSILYKHLVATNMLKRDPLFKDLDLVVWPENAADLNPLANPAAKAVINQLVDQTLKVPLLFGTITERGSDIFNSLLLWKPKSGLADYYDKIRPIPFAEYVPDRGFWYPLAPDLIGLISRGFSFGTRDGIFEVGSAKFGSLICFEIAIDELNRNLVLQGAQVILAQSNNSDFGHSDETFQQAAIVRLRAIETGRPIVYDSTVGASAVYLPNGRVVEQLDAFTRGAFIAKLPLRSSLTPAMIIDPWFDWIINLTAISLIAISFGAWIRRAKS